MQLLLAVLEPAGLVREPGPDPTTTVRTVKPLYLGLESENKVLDRTEVGGTVHLEPRPVGRADGQEGPKKPGTPCNTTWLAPPAEALQGLAPHIATGHPVKDGQVYRVQERDGTTGRAEGKRLISMPLTSARTVEPQGSVVDGGKTRFRVSNVVAREHSAALKTDRVGGLRSVSGA